MHAVVEHTDAQEHRARDEAVRNHLDQTTLHAHLIEDEKAERHKAHMGD